MLIRPHIEALCAHYQEHLPIIREFIGEVLVWAENVEALWIEQWEDPELRLTVTPVINKRLGPMVESGNLKEFGEILAFLRSREIQCDSQVPGGAVGRVASIAFHAADFVKLQYLQDLMGDRP